MAGDIQENQKKENLGVQARISMLIEHGKRKGFISRHNIYDCVPEAKFDNQLFQEILDKASAANLVYFEEDLPDDPNEKPPDDEQGLESIDTLAEPEIANLENIETNDMIRLYLQEATQVPLLNAEEELGLAQRIERGILAQEEMSRGKVRKNRLTELRRIVEEGKWARERLIQANARLVVSVARKYNGRGLPFGDLIQEGNIGLMRAIRNYDYHRGFKFSTYATWWIRQAITRALASQSRTIRLPVYMSDQVNRMLREQTQLQQKLGRTPTTKELAGVLAIPVSRVEQMMELVKQPLSLQSPVGEDEEEALGDFIEDVESPDPEETVSEMLESEDLQKMLDSLPERERRVLQLRFGLGGERPLTLNEVGSVMGITRERVRQLEVQALKRLRSPSA